MPAWVTAWPHALPSAHPSPLRSLSVDAALGAAAAAGRRAQVVGENVLVRPAGCKEMYLRIVCRVADVPQDAGPAGRCRAVLGAGLACTAAVLSFVAVRMAADACSAMIAVACAAYNYRRCCPDPLRLPAAVTTVKPLQGRVCCGHCAHPVQPDRVGENARPGAWLMMRDWPAAAAAATAAMVAAVPAVLRPATLLARVGRCTRLLR